MVENGKEENKQNKKMEQETKNEIEEKMEEKVKTNESLLVEETKVVKVPMEFSDRPKYIMLEKTKALYTMMHSYLELFPKTEKFTLRQKIEDTILESIKLLILQNYKQIDKERREKMLEFLANLYLLEVLIQQAYIFRYLSIDGFNRCINLLKEINMISLRRNYSPYAQMQVQSDNENRSRNKTEENAVISVMK